jgi:hypothetical protein
MQITATEDIDIALIHEPYLYLGEIKGVPGKYRTYSHRGRKKKGGSYNS